MLNIANPAPWFDKTGAMHWYVGNTFQLELEITLTDGDTGEAIPWKPSDEVIVRFIKQKDQTLVHSFFFTDILNNTILLSFNKKITEKFPEGKYEMGITKNGSDVQTIVPFNAVIVDKAV